MALWFKILILFFKGEYFKSQGTHKISSTCAHKPFLNILKLMYCQTMHSPEAVLLPVRNKKNNLFDYFYPQHPRNVNIGEENYLWSR